MIYYELQNMIEKMQNNHNNVKIDDKELDERRIAEEARGKEAFTPKTRRREVSKALRAYASMVTSADKGGVRE